MLLWPIQIALVPLIFLSSLFLPSNLDSSHRSHIDALAPVEVVAKGFREPMGVVFDDESETIIVSDRRAGKVFEVTAGEAWPIVTHLKRPVGLAFDYENRLLIVEQGKGRVIRLEPDDSLSVVTKGIKNPRWLAVAKDAIYISAKGLRSKREKGRYRGRKRGGDRDDDDDDDDDDDGKHWKYWKHRKHRKYGEVILRLTPDGQLSVFASGFKRLEGLAIYDESLFAAAGGYRDVRRWHRRWHKRGKRYNRGGVFQIPIQADGTAGPITRLTQNRIRKPVGLVIDRLGAPYVTAKRIKVDRKVKRAIGKAAPDGTLSRFASRLNRPRGLALDYSGNLYVADGNGKRRGRIVRFKAPPPPTLAAPPFTNQNPITLTGTTEANSYIDAFLNDLNDPITISTQDGSFSLTLNSLLDTNYLSVSTTTHSGEGLTSAPAEFTIIHDDVIPLISNLQPTDGSFLNNATPLVRADFSDNLSGVDVSKVEILRDGFSATSLAAITATGFTLNGFPLSEGAHTVSVTVVDFAGNSSSDYTNFTVDVTAPVISNVTPIAGSVVATATPLIEAQFGDNLSGVNPASVSILLDGVDRTAQSVITPSGFTLDPSNPIELSQGSHSVFISVSDLAGNVSSAQSTFTLSLGPELNPIGNKTVDAGSTLSFTVSATDSGGGAVTLSATPLPLPANMSFNTVTGEFAFAPALDQVGSFQLTFTATSNGQSDSETITITVQTPPVIDVLTDILIDEDNLQFEGRTIQIDGKTVTVDGSHTFANLVLANGAVLTHSPTTANKLGKLELQVTGNLQIDATSKIDVTGRGSLGGSQPGSTGRSGGSYGGLGGSLDGSSNPVYGDFRDPNEPGSRGGSQSSAAGSGGGVIRLVVQTLQLDGSISADGSFCTGSSCGGGSGGGIRIDVGTLQGTGQITARGGHGVDAAVGGGGGGGRIAVYFQDAAGFDLTKVTAFGGVGTGGVSFNGGAGTVLLQGPGREGGELIVDSPHPFIAISTPIPSDPSGLLALTNLRVSRAASVRIDDEINLTSTLEVSSGAELTLGKRVIAPTITVTDSSMITQLPTTATAFFKVDLSADTLTVDATSRIDVTGRGFLGGSQPGNPFGESGMTLGLQSGSTGRSGGSYGGLGGALDGSSNPVYGDLRDPNEPGSGGGSLLGSAASNGGGLIRIVAQTLNLDGTIKADGETRDCCSVGGGSGGGIRIDVGTLQGTGQITARGGHGVDAAVGGGGGGGRIAVYFQDAAGFDLTKVTAFGGVGTGGVSFNGGAGTVFLEQTL